MPRWAMWSRSFLTVSCCGQLRLPRRARVRHMSEKPHVYVPAGEAPPVELVIEDIEVANGDEAKAGHTVEVHYAGNAWSTRQQFDASWDRGDTFSFKLGAGQVIGGGDKGVTGMKIGGRRPLVIPPDLGYGSRGAGGVIKPNETLVFVVDLI